MAVSQIKVKGFNLPKCRRQSGLNQEDFNFICDWYEYVFSCNVYDIDGYFMEWIQRYKEGFVAWTSYMSGVTLERTNKFINEYLKNRWK